jgi:hypothetical protein
MDTWPTGPAGPVLRRFLADIGGVVPLVALWAHGSLALGDFQPGRSDLDLVALVATDISEPQRQRLEQVHRELMAAEPLAEKLHCSYVVRAQLPGAARDHLTWAHAEMYERTVSPVSRRELCLGGLSLSGPAPAGLVPPVTDAELAGYIRRDLEDNYLPATDRPELWLQDIWVDLGVITLARASVTLRDERLITKREAFEVARRLGAPPDVLDDIYRRRYAAAPPPVSAEWRARRAELARAFVRAGIMRLLAQTAQPTRPAPSAGDDAAG